MTNIIEKIKSFHSNEDGLETIEYALMAALVAIAIIIGAQAMGTAANVKYTSVAGVIGSAGLGGT